MIIPQAVFDLYNQTTSDMITQNFGVRCKLIYDFERTECPNCLFNEINNCSAGYYKSGGPIPFDGIQCPYCAGVGYSLTETSDTIKLRVYYNKKDFVKVELPINITDSSIQTIGFITDLPKIRRADIMMANIDIAGYEIYRYELAAQPLPWGLGADKKYFVAFWNATQ